MNKCIKCLQEFKVKPYRKDKAKYCSYDCYWGKSTNKKSKKCNKCNKTYSINCFQRVNRGFESRCKICKAREYRNWSRRNLSKEKYRNYKYRSLSKNREFSLLYAEFLEQLSKDECFYCGIMSKQLGLDRVDSKIGYRNDNVVACCKRCNIAKNDMSQKDFILLCKNVAKRHGL